MTIYRKILRAVFLCAFCWLLLPAAGGADTVVTPGRERCGEENCYWCLPMDITREEDIWNALIAPVTVIAGDEKTQYLLRAEPRADAEAVGEITCKTQGLHVLETLENGWTRVETYSSSFYGSTVQAWDQLVEGYVETARLTQILPSDKYGFVVDKMTQRMYMFKDGKLYSTLLISTGLPNERQPYNETRSGQFLLVSAAGNFMSGNLLNRFSLRFNDGDLMHEAPWILFENGRVDKDTMQEQLGQRSSFGCVRVQRHRTPEGINMEWIWLNFQKYTPIWIWEDLPGRTVTPPADDTVLYYSPADMRCYHTSPACHGVQESLWPGMTEVRYGQLEDGEFAGLEACRYCNPPLRKQEIEELNARYALEEAAE